MPVRDTYSGTYETLAFDFSSNRTYDRDGRLHVASSNISRANVCPYYGYEIPKFKELGLEPYKTYRLLRDPEELRKAAPTFNNLPILDKHIHVSSTTPYREHVVGTTGSGVSFDGEHLTSPTSFWTDNAIKGIEDRSKCQLSSCYHYRADMSPGVYNGAAYDGRMVDIHGNHVALVPRGRAGNTVTVGDHAMKPRFYGFASKKFIKGTLMPTKPAAKQAKPAPRATRPAIHVFAQGAIMNFLRPHLAQDAAIDLRPVLATLGNGVGFDADKFRVALLAAVAPVNGVPKLAADADIADVTEVIEQLQDMAPEIADLVVGGPEALANRTAQENPDGVPPPGDPAAADPNNPADPAPPPAADPAGKPGDNTAPKGVDPVSKTPADNVADSETSDPKSPPDSGENPPVEGKDPPVADPVAKAADPAAPTSAVSSFIDYLSSNKLSDEELSTIQAALEKAMATEPSIVTKPAMDAAIARATTEAVNATVKRMNDVAAAQRLVMPYVGPVLVAMDSAESVYRFALKALKVPGAEKMHSDALLPVLMAQPKPGERQRTSYTAPALAADAEPVKKASYDDRYGDASKRLVG